MSYFDQRPNVFRGVFGTAAVFLFIFGGYGIYKFGSSPTDENIFENPPSPAYVTRTQPADRISNATEQPSTDSLLAGDLVLSANGQRFPSVTDGRRYIAALNDSATVDLEILRPTDREKYTYRLRKSSLQPDLVRELPPTALVVDVTPGGASDRAGMMIGDHIMRINGQTFSNVAEADSILRQGQIGKTIDYEILRGNQPMTLQVTLASFGIQFAFLLYALCGLVYVVVGIFLGLARPQFVAMRLLAVFFVSVGYIMIISILNRGLGSGVALTIRTWSLSICFLTALPVLLHSFHYFPVTRPDLLRRTWIRRTGYVFSLALFIVARVAPGVVSTIMAIALALYVFLIPFIGRKETSPEYKRMSAPIKWTSMAMGFSGLLFSFFVSRASGTVILRMLSLLGIILLVLPAAYLYTIGRYRLFNLALRVRRGVQYSFVSILWTTLIISAIMSGISWLVQSDLRMPYIRITSSSIEVTNAPTSQREQAMMARGFLVVFAFGVVFIMIRVHKAGSRFISEKFYRARYDYRRAASEVAEVMTTTLNMTQLARGIVEKLASLMQLKRVGLLFFRNEKECCCNEAYGFDGNSWSEFCMEIGNVLDEGLKSQVHEVNVSSLSPGTRESFTRQGFHYIVPIRSKDRLVGLILIGEKMSESAFRLEDMEFLAAIAKQASVAIENAFLYEELTEQERLKHELAIARKIQLESLPQSTPDIEGLDIAGVSVPALEVGGDYFDYLNGDSTKLTVIVGDVSGKGTSAALYMSKVQGILRSLHGFGLGPRELFVRANHLLCKDLEKRSFVTAMGAAFNTKEKSLLLARAGHLPLFHFKASQSTVETITPRGLGLGLSPENLFATELEERRIDYGRGDVFVFVTDGITEGQKVSGDEFGEERVTKILAQSSNANAVAIRDRVISEVKTFAGNANQHDDQTVVVVRVT